MAFGPDRSIRVLCRRILLLALSLSGCAEQAPRARGPEGGPISTPSSTPPAPSSPALSLDDAIVECADLIGTVNRAVARFEAGGGEGLGGAARAREEVAEELLRHVFKVPDLARLGGFYVGIVRGEARVLRELDAASSKGDAGEVAKLEASFEMLGSQEDAVVAELNAKCRGIEATEPGLLPLPSSAPPSSVPPSGP